MKLPSDTRISTAWREAVPPRPTGGGMVCQANASREPGRDCLPAGHGRIKMLVKDQSGGGSSASPHVISCRRSGTESVVAGNRAFAIASTRLLPWRSCG